MDQGRGLKCVSGALISHVPAGNPAKFEELIAGLRKELEGVEGDDSSAYSLAVSLLLNGRGSDAIKLLKERPKRGAGLTFDMLCAQLKFKEAFALADQASESEPILGEVFRQLHMPAYLKLNEIVAPIVCGSPKISSAKNEMVLR